LWHTISPESDRRHYAFSPCHYAIITAVWLPLQQWDFAFSVKSLIADHHRIHYQNEGVIELRFFVLTPPEISDTPVGQAKAPLSEAFVKRGTS
jgi:hypothetical protein